MRGNNNDFSESSICDDFRCPICDYVWASDRAGLHTHALTVHNMGLPELWTLPSAHDIVWNEVDPTTLDVSFQTQIQAKINDPLGCEALGPSNSFCPYNEAYISQLATEPGPCDLAFTLSQRKVQSRNNSKSKRRTSLASRARAIRNGRVLRSRSRTPPLRCPVCNCVWTSDWNGLCSHADCVHDINLQDFLAIKPLLELRARMMSAINRVKQGEKCEASDVDDEFDESAACLWSEAFFQLDEASSRRNAGRPNEDTFNYQSSSEVDFHQTPKNARREVRSLSDFGVRSDVKRHPVRERSVSVTPLNSPQLEDLYQSYRMHNTVQQFRTKYEQKLQERRELIKLVLPKIVNEIAKIDQEVQKCLIGGYALY